MYIRRAFEARTLPCSASAVAPFVTTMISKYFTFAYTLQFLALE
jgi:hypothetical protein